MAVFKQLKKDAIIKIKKAGSGLKALYSHLKKLKAELYQMIAGRTIHIHSTQIKNKLQVKGTRGKTLILLAVPLLFASSVAMANTSDALVTGFNQYGSEVILIIIVISYIVAFLLYHYSPKNKNIFVFLSVPSVIAIIGILINFYNQTCLMVDTFPILWMFIVSNVTLIASGALVKYQLKYFFLSHVISSVLHIWFYFYCEYNPIAGELTTFFPPIIIYLILFAWTLLVLSHFVRLKQINIRLVGSLPLMDGVLSFNEANSDKILVLLQAYLMIIHVTFVGFLQGYSEKAIWLYIVIPLVIVLQLLIIFACLQIMNKYPSSGNVPFYVSAHLMIVKLLTEQLYKNYQIYKDNKPPNLQSEYFSNKLIYLFLYTLVLCAFNGGVAYASGEECASPTVEGQSAGRYARTGISFAGVAGGYEGVSYLREWLENRVELADQRDEFNTEIQQCVIAKTQLEAIQFRYQSEQELINKAELILNYTSPPERSDITLESIADYRNKVTSVTIEMQSKHQTYTQYQDNWLDQLARRAVSCGTNCCQPISAKES